MLFYHTEKELTLTKTSELQATITGALILVLLKQLDTEDSHKGSVIKLIQRLAGVLKKTDKKHSVLADKAFNIVREKYQDAKLELDIGILIEGLAFNKMTYMQELFGIDIVNLVERAAYKITIPNLTQQQGKDSWMIADELKEALEKVTFEHLKGKE